MTHKPSTTPSPRLAARLSARLPHRFKPSRLVALLANALLVPAASAASSPLPTGMTVVSGQASATQSGSQLTITNSSNAILNWQSFSIGSGNTVQFVQPGSTSQVLNRVTGNDPSTLLGSLTSNGRVWLLNPNGVLFGQGARVDVGSLVVSTLDISNQDWLAGNYHFESAGANAASIDNQGTLRGSLGGRVALIGGSVSNEGLIEAPGGQVLLAAGQSVDLVDTGAPNLSVHVSAPSGEVLNLGELSAAGGRIDVYGAAVNQQGIVRADSLTTGPGGTVVLAASGQLTLAGGSRTSADSASGTGGQVQLTGTLVALEDGSTVSASGATGGGTVLAGGGAQGRDASVANAQALYFGRGATIDADALVSGDGGHIVLWSDSATRAYGSLSAHGGAQAGNGGLVETSGGWLDARPLALDVSAAHGLAGTWLLDPYNVTITDGATDANFDSSFTATGDATISSATLIQALNTGTNVTIDTGGSAGSSNGDITVSGANILVSAAAPGSLTLVADHNIRVMSSTIQSTGGAMPVGLYAGRGGDGSIDVDSSTISTAGGSLFLGGYGSYVDAAGVSHSNAALANGSDYSIGYGVEIYNSTLDAGAGDIGIYGSSANYSYDAVYVSFSTLSGHDITMSGAESASDSFADGIYFSQATLQATHAIDIQGNNTGSGTGVSLFDSTLTTAPAAADTTAYIKVLGAALQGDGTDISAVDFTASNGASITLAGNSNDSMAGGLFISAADASTQMLIDTSNAGGPITLSASGSNQGIEVDDTTVTASTAGLTVNAGNLPLQLSDAFVTSDGKVALVAGEMSLVQGTSITSNATGDAIVASGSGGGIGSLVTDSGTIDPFTAANGRWIVWLTDTSAQPSTAPTFDFQRFGVTSAADWAGDAGNGLVYSQAASVNVTGTITSRAYDGTLAATASQLSVTNTDAYLQAGMSSTAYVQFADKNAGTGKSIDLLDSAAASPVVVTDTARGKPVYGVTVTDSLTGTITPKTLTGTVSISKVYDGNASYSTTVTGLTGLVGSETVQVGATGTLVDKNVGTNKLTNTVNYQVTDGTNGGLASNYAFVGPITPLGTITPLAITLGGLTVADKTYDATTAATASGSPLIATLTGDNVTLSGTAQYSFSDKNVGTNKAVSVSGLSLAGTDAGNYTLVTSGLFTADITPAVLALSGLVAQSKVYDTTTAATLAGTGTVAALGTDQVTVVVGQANFSDKNVGQGKTVTLTGFSLSGADAGNYTLAQPATQSASITPATLNLGGLVAQGKVYDATTAATATGAASVAPLAGDSVTVAGTPQLAFADANVGQGKAVSVSGLSLAGADAGNYTLVTSGLLTASITPATLTYVSVPATVFDGDAVPQFEGSVTGFVGGETLATATTGTAYYINQALSDSSGASGKVTLAAGQYAIDGGGLSATNYVFVQDAGNAQALTVAGPRRVDDPATQQTVASTNTAVASQRAHPDAGKGNVIDLTGLYPTSDSGALFGAAPLSDMSPGAVSALIGARDDYKQTLLAGSLGQLAVQPGLADLHPCQSMEEAAAGTCLVTEAFKRQARAALAPLAQAPAGESPPAAPAPAQAPVQAPAQVVAATPAAAAPQAITPLFSFRPVRSATLPQIEHKVAVLIGVNDYRDDSIPHLTHAVGDAQAMSDLFLQRLGYDTLTLSNPTRATVVATLNRLALEMGPRDSVLVYYAGHGAVADGEGAGKGEGYWLLADSQATKPETWLSNADISRLLGVIGADQVALISDSCYSGKLASGTRIGVTPGADDPGKILAHRAEVVMSSGGNEPVFDAGKNGHSPFAWNLLETLGKTSGWTPGGRVFERVRFAVARELPQHPQYAGAGNHQADADYLFEQRQLDGPH